MEICQSELSCDLGCIMLWDTATTVPWVRIAPGMNVSYCFVLKSLRKTEAYGTKICVF
jgi:hypothetical protein